MRLRISRILFILGCSALLAPTASAFNVASFGEARAVIVTGKDPPPTVRAAAEELTNYLNRIVAGAKFKISERPVGGKNTIRLGTPYPGGKPDEFAVFVNKRSELELTGTPPRGTVYAAYAFLESLGCRYWTPWQETVPSAKSLVWTNAVKRVETPAWAIRLNGGSNGRHVRWAVKNHLTTGSWYNIPPELGGESSFAAGETLATPHGQISPLKYFATHPDWYALRLVKPGESLGAGTKALEVAEGRTPESRLAGKGKRPEGKVMRVGTQICASNPEVAQTLIEEVRAELAKKPDTAFLPIGINDNDLVCQCQRCADFNAKHEGRCAAAYLDLANQVARAIAKDYPKTRIVFLAYWAAGSPPRQMKAEPNIEVSYPAGINLTAVKPLVDDKDYIRAIQLWQGIAPAGFYIWAYYANFSNFLYPNQDFDYMGPNFRLYKKLGVTGVSAQLPIGTELADFNDLRNWLYAQMEWNPERDEIALINAFIDGTCGKGAPFIRDYVDRRIKLREEARKGGKLRADASGNELLKWYSLVLQALDATRGVKEPGTVRINEYGLRTAFLPPEGDEPAYASVEKLEAGLLALLISADSPALRNAARSKKVPLPEREELFNQFLALTKKYKSETFMGEHRSVQEWIDIMRARK